MRRVSLSLLAAAGVLVGCTVLSGAIADVDNPSREHASCIMTALAQDSTAEVGDGVTTSNTTFELLPNPRPVESTTTRHDVLYQEFRYIFQTLEKNNRLVDVSLQALGSPECPTAEYLSSFTALVDLVSDNCPTMDGLAVSHVGRCGGRS